MVESPKAMKHDTPEKQKIGHDNCILLTEVGSGLHGMALPGKDDHDEVGVCIEPPEFMVGLKRFEQYEFRTQPMHVRSGFGDTDRTIYSLRKWAQLASQGNPTVILPLFAPEEKVFYARPPGHELRAKRSMFISQSCGPRYIGYLDRQRLRMIGALAQRTNRPELVAEHGYDTKFAAHALRLALQGIELLRTGELTLPIPERNYLIGMRQGAVPKQEALYQIDWLRARLVKVLDGGESPLPERADYDAINKWLTVTYITWWGHDK